MDPIHLAFLQFDILQYNALDQSTLWDNGARKCNVLLVIPKIEPE